MRFHFVLAYSALALLAACTPPASEPAPAAIEEVVTFEDGNCLGYLILQRTAIAEGRAQGDEAALGTALEAWRASASGTLRSMELAQYEASSIAVHDDTDAATLATEAARCVATAPQG